MLWRWTLGHLSMPVLEGQDPLWTGRNVLSSSAAPRHGKHGGNTVLFCLVLRQGPPVHSRLVLYSPGWPESHNPPTLASWVLRLWTHAARACFVCSFFCFPTQICFRARAAMKKFFESKNVRALCLSKKTLSFLVWGVFVHPLFLLLLLCLYNKVNIVLYLLSLTVVGKMLGL